MPIRCSWGGRGAGVGGEGREEILGAGRQGATVCECDRTRKSRQGELSPADSPLMLMASAACLEGVRLLLSYKADPGRANKARRGGRDARVGFLSRRGWGSSSLPRCLFSAPSFAVIAPTPTPSRCGEVFRSFLLHLHFSHRCRTDGRR